MEWIVKCFHQKKDRRVVIIMDMRTYINQFYIFLNKLSPERFDMCWEERIPLLGEDTNSMGFNVDYVYHLGWAARIIAKNKPEVHYDLSSSIWLNSVLSAFIPVKAYEFRKLNVNLEGLECGDADILKLPFESNSITSLSCLSVLEHIGLGKYGDEIDPDGDLKAIEEIKRVVAPNGDLLINVPIGPTPKVIFNAHRIYSHKQIVDYFEGFELKEFAFILTDKAEFLVNPQLEKIEHPVRPYGHSGYNSGCFWFRKK